MIQRKLRIFLSISMVFLIQPQTIAQSASAESLRLVVQQSSYKYEEMDSLLSAVRNLERLPSFQALDEPTELSGESASDEIRELYDEVRQTIFAKQIVVAVPCVNCHFRADYGSARVFYNPASVTEIKRNYTDWKSVLKYIFAHETSHLIQNMACYQPYTSRPGFTLNNLTIPCAEQIFDSSQALDATRQFHIFHAETDVYMALNLSRSGFRSWETVFAYLENEAKKYEASTGGSVVAADFRNRSRAIKDVLADLATRNKTEHLRADYK